MTARQVDDAAERLRELQVLGYESLGLAALAFALALAASRLHPSFATPLLAGGAVMTFLGLRALVRRWFFVEDLADMPEAYELPDVRRYCIRAASPEHRHALVVQLRALLDDTTAHRDGVVRPELVELVTALEHERQLEPQAAFTLDRRLRDCLDALRDPSVPVDELRARLLRAVAGLSESGP